MRSLFVSALFALPLVSGCLLPLPGSTPSGVNHVQPDESGSPQPGGPTTLAGPTAPEQAHSAPSPVSVDLKNECTQTVRLFYGEKPKFGSGTYSTLGSNTRTSKSMKPGEMIWLVDESDNGIGSVTVSAEAPKVTVDCATIASG